MPLTPAIRVLSVDLSIVHKAYLISRPQAAIVIMNCYDHRRDHLQCSLYTVSNDVITEILARVASSSLPDLCSLRCANKLLHGLADDIYVFKHVSMERIPPIPWWPFSVDALSFLQRCLQSHNPEALYRLGMIEFFNKVQFKAGVALLERATSFSHDGATYVLGMILLCGEDEESRLHGIDVLDELEEALHRRSRCGYKISDCRKKCQRILSSMWVKCSLRQQEHACENGCKRNSGRGWDADDCNGFNCKSCKWDYELKLFRSLFTNS
ncbi:hypothetical protein Sjap_020424 [Stephania japonica]|uniref:At2g35280-like TPR domain-containing protein n=1 Tax=Stephania japonica TaxID=461633 RepID=A0AAP0I0F2_9MAGN